MALTAAQISQVYDIIELPQSGSALLQPTPGNPFDHIPHYYDASATVTAIDAKLAALTAEQITRVGTLLTRWDSITSTSPTRILDKGGSVLADHPEERRNIKGAIEHIIGLKLPKFPGVSADNSFSIQR